MKQLPKRLLSIDVLRALTMLLMIFVNDASGVDRLPAWLDHAKEYEDAMGFADTIFPAFLFIMGLSIPLAIKNQRSKGASTNQILFHILTRGLALLIMGFYHVNMESYSKAAILPQPVWEIIITLSFFLIWLDYPKDSSPRKKYVLQGSGIVLLLIMAALYKGGDAANPHWMHPSWWGILGIIGWSYLVCALVYLFSKGKNSILITVYILFIGLNIASHSVLAHFNLPVIGDASSVSLAMGGVLLSLLYTHLAERNKLQQVWIIFTAIGIALIAGGLLLRPYTEGISKIRSTPAWVLICSGITVLAFEFFIFVVDWGGKIKWFQVLRPAGTSTLTCYLIPYLQVGIFDLLHINYPNFLNYGIGGACRSMAVGLIIIILVGFLEKKRLRLKI